MNKLIKKISERKEWFILSFLILLISMIAITWMLYPPLCEIEVKGTYSGFVDFNTEFTEQIYGFELSDAGAEVRMTIPCRIIENWVVRGAS